MTFGCPLNHACLQYSDSATVVMISGMQFVMTTKDALNITPAESNTGNLVGDFDDIVSGSITPRACVFLFVLFVGGGLVSRM
jgi:hypothetical protein